MQLFSLVSAALLIHPAVCASIQTLDSHSLWKVFTRLEYKDMKSFVRSNPSMLRDHNVKAVVLCKGNYVCAFNSKPSRLLFQHVPHHLHSYLIRHAALKNEEHTVKQMIKSGINPKWLDYPLKRALHLELEDQVEWIRSLLPHSMRNIQVDQTGARHDFDRILEAIRQGRLQELIEAGADVNAKDNTLGRPLLLEALKHGEGDMEQLIMHGADVNAQDKHGMTALILGAFLGRVPNILIEVGADLNVKDVHGRTALLFAASYSHLKAVNALIAAGADLNMQDKYGQTALMKAAAQGDFETVKVLIKAGASVDVKDNSGLTALKYAKSHPKIIVELKTAKRKLSPRWQRMKGFFSRQ